ncbi:hypothetical protein M378DRAFT_163135 [Amanita muscaria Koide BX008]|uniref:Uncharacterized protein n=1 Tax=Amanita muscaria (strain Koide BX008) TaxID=946122 RepID=A0A0C2SMD1_AMAMK|nr:hypothetical protein M378DRAFT_163135 [Amanita muscaria Koide BX008]
MLSWKSPFIGKAHKALYDTISNVCSGSARNIYERLLAVVQSSGMGKSRMIDELSKEQFVIPINLRITGTGFPPGDYVVSKFLVHAPFTPDDASRRAQAFLISLFEITAKTVPDLDRVLGGIISKLVVADRPTSNAQKFRLFMSHGQSYSQPGELRRKFYHQVIRRAGSILKLPLQDDMEITESEDSSIDMTENEDSSIDMTEGEDITMGSPEDQKIECIGSPVINFIEEGKPLSLHQSALELVKILAPDMSLTTESLQSKPPLIILAYDEAHGLSFPKNEDKPRAPTAYSQHRRVLRRLRTLPIFALFLSTTGKVHDLTPPPEFDSSDRLRYLTLRLLAPFSALGFDQMAKAPAFTTDDQNLGINDVSKVGFMVRFGRPLWGSRYQSGSLDTKGDIVGFARQKLMHGEDLKTLSSSVKLALMSVRLALEFNAQTTEARACEMEQVEKYMRVCILVHKGFETAVTISPSEPLLAEAARHSSIFSFNMPASLLEHLTKMGQDKGDRGELVAQVILILAADKACEEHLNEQLSTPTVGSQHQPILEMPTVSTVPRAFFVELFIKALLKGQWHNDVLRSLPAKWRTKTESNRTFQTAFKDTRIYFSHFIKLDDPAVVNREFLWRLAIRGCVALCADGQHGINIIAPLVFGIETLCRSNISALFVQVKNDKSFRAQPNAILFDLMNPYLVRFFDMDEKTPLPIIRMIFALGSPTAAVKVIPQDVERLPRKAKTAAQKAVQRSPRYTSYDIWCAKASSETFGVIKIEDEQNYSLLLKTERVFPQVYRSEFGIERIENIRRSMNPGTSVEGAHWASFCGAKTPQLQTVDLGDNVDFGEESDYEVKA